MAITQDELKAQLTTIKGNGLLRHFQNASGKTGVALPLLLGIGSRETNLKNIAQIGGGNGKGIMQVDSGYHDISSINWKRNPGALILYAANLIDDNMSRIQRQFPGSSLEAVYRMTAASYNCGYSGMLRGHEAGNCDLHTTKGNYGADVLKRTAVFAALIGKRDY